MGRDLGQVGDHDHLGVPRERREARADVEGRPAPDPGIDWDSVDRAREVIAASQNGDLAPEELDGQITPG